MKLLKKPNVLFLDVLGVLPAVPVLLPAVSVLLPAVPGMLPAVPALLPARPGMLPAVPGMLPAVPGMLPAVPGILPAVPGMLSAVDQSGDLVAVTMQLVDSSLPPSNIPHKDGTVKAACITKTCQSMTKFSFNF